MEEATSPEDMTALGEEGDGDFEDLGDLGESGESGDEIEAEEEEEEGAPLVVVVFGTMKSKR